MLPSTSTSSKNACNGGKGRIENTNSRKRREIKKQNDPDGERERAKKRQTCKKSRENGEMMNSEIYFVLCADFSLFFAREFELERVRKKEGKKFLAQREYQMRQKAGNGQVGDQTGSLRSCVSGIIFAKTENRFRMKVKVEKKEGAGSAARSARFFFFLLS